MFMFTSFVYLFLEFISCLLVGWLVMVGWLVIWLVGWLVGLFTLVLVHGPIAPEIFLTKIYFKNRQDSNCLQHSRLGLRNTLRHGRGVKIPYRVSWI